MCFVASQTHGFILPDLCIETAFLAGRSHSLCQINAPKQTVRQSFLEFRRALEPLEWKKSAVGQTRSKCIEVTIAATRHSSQLRWFAKLCVPSRLVKSPQFKCVQVKDHVAPGPKNGCMMMHVFPGMWKGSLDLIRRQKARELPSNWYCCTSLSQNPNGQLSNCHFHILLAEYL